MVHNSAMHKLAAYLSTQELTHEQMAAKLGISRAHFTKIANGTAWPSRKLMLLIASETSGAVPVTAWFGAEAAE